MKELDFASLPHFLSPTHVFIRKLETLADFTARCILAGSHMLVLSS